MDTSRNNLVVALIAIIVIGIAGGAYVFLSRDISCPTTTLPPSPESNTAWAIPSADSKVPQVVIPSSIDLASLLGTIGTYEKAKRSGTSAAFNPYGDIDILTTGTRYVLYHTFSIKQEGGAAVFEIFDLSEKKPVDSFVAAQVFKTPQALIFSPNSKSLCVYKPDTSSCEPLNGSTLQGNEKYWDPMGNPIEVTAHTASSFTITVWLGSERSREATYQIP